ncbi:MAG: lamin tail domain-containing protein [Clostridia bacterium]|nr:lamin tail domain-containing protein [Clostridia bacterium]
MSQTRRRRGSAQQPDIALRTRRRNKARIVVSIFAFAAALALLLLITPRGQTRAQHTIASEDGTLENEEGVVATHAYSGLRISEVMPSNHTAVPDENGKFADWVEIWNASTEVRSLSGIGLSDRGDSIRFLFPDISLPPDGRVVVYCDNTNQVESGKPFHAKFKLSSVGEKVYLYDPNAYVIDSVSYGILGSDTSWSLLPDGQWAEVPYFSPGYENTQTGHAAYRTDTMVTDGALIINEVCADPKSGLTDQDGEFVDWVELYNTTDRDISLDLYALSDKENRPLRWRFPDGAVVPARGYYLVFCSGKNRRDDPTDIPHTDFRLSAEHDTLVLSDSRGRIVDRTIIDNLPEDASWARDPNGIFSVHPMTTPGRDNADVGGADTDLRRRNISGVYITEVMASNDSVKTLDDTTFVDWIELYNAGTEQMNLSGYGLSDNIGRPRRWQFPAGTVINPGTYLIVHCDGNEAASTAQQPHTSFRIVRAGGETVCLSDPQGKVLDKMILPTVPTNISYGRTAGISGFFYYDTPTPGAANAGGFKGYAEPPEFTVAPGLHYGTVQTGFTIPEGTTVFYTTDGSVPTRDSARYGGEILELNFTGILRARAFSDDELIYPSTITSGSFLVNTYHNLPVFSLITDPQGLWNETDGMLVTGSNVVKEPGKLPFKNTIYRQFGKTLNREVHVEYYQLDGTQVLNQDSSFRLMGDYSLDMPQKSMKFRAKSLYGAKTFSAALFEDRPYTEYKSIVLRNSGNDCMWTRLQDGFQSRLLDAYQASATYSEDTIPVIHQAWKPVVVYINGVYWGHMNLRERVDRFFVAQHEGLALSDADKMVILQGSGTVKVGVRSDRKEWQAFLQKVKKSNPAKNQEDLQYILDNVDVDNLFEYMAFEMFVGNSDIGNTRYYRLKTPGSKWRWILYDVDYGLYDSGFNSPKSYTKTQGMGQMKIDNTVFRALLSVPEYKDKFLRKMADVYYFLSTDKMLEILEPLVAQIEPEMGMHWARWGELNDPYVISEVPTTADGAYRYWEKRVERLRNVCRKRPRLLWGFIKDAFGLSNLQMLEYFGPQPEFPEGVV